MSTRALVECFARWSQECDALVLVTVVETQGSTYSKTGTQLLMRNDGQHAGLVSGGCLEGDLAEHAHKVMTSGEPAIVTYDMRDDADDLWGIGLGCNGLMRLLLQKITAANDWHPFKDICAALADAQPHTIRLLTHRAYPDSHLGECAIDAGQDNSAAWQTQPWTRLLVLGAAPDAEPVVALARQLGWAVTVADHRSHYLQANDFSAADHCRQIDPTQLTQQIAVNDFDAVVIMSHHLETDRKYLQALQTSTASYIGLLGPTARKEKLLADLGAGASQLADRLHGPVGLAIGANSPETIALALLSEIQAVMTKSAQT